MFAYNNLTVNSWMYYVWRTHEKKFSFMDFSVRVYLDDEHNKIWDEEGSTAVLLA